MNEDELLVNLESTLFSAQRSETRGDGDTVFAKTAVKKRGNRKRAKLLRSFFQETVSLQSW